MKHHPQNVKRAHAALSALRVYCGENYAGANPDIMPCGDIECAVQDLINDLLHYYRQLPDKRKECMWSECELLDKALHVFEDELKQPVM